MWIWLEPYTRAKSYFWYTIYTAEIVWWELKIYLIIIIIELIFLFISL